MSTEQDEEERLIRLLEATHTFPGQFTVTVIAVNDDSVAVALLRAVEAGLDGPLQDTAHVTNASRGGRYISHRFTVSCREARDVLGIYARVRTVQGVMTVL